jgi:hypothetical protein
LRSRLCAKWFRMKFNPCHSRLLHVYSVALRTSQGPSRDVKQYFDDIRSNKIIHGYSSASLVSTAYPITTQPYSSTVPYIVADTPSTPGVSLVTTAPTARTSVTDGVTAVENLCGICRCLQHLLTNVASPYFAQNSPNIVGIVPTKTPTRVLSPDKSCDI